MAMSVSITRRFQQKAENAGMVQRTELAWVSASDGSVTSDPFDLIGTIIGVEFVPDSGGTQPSDAYDFTLTDANGYDLLRGQGANLSQSTKTRVCPVIT